MNDAGPSRVERAPEGEDHRRPHERLDVWEKAMLLAEDIYRLTRSFPAEERYGLVAQMRRSAVSVVSNIAEGAARRSGREFEQFLYYVAQGSLSELEAQVELSRRLGFISKTPNDRLRDVARMLIGLIRYARRRGDGAAVTRRVEST